MLSCDKEHFYCDVTNVYTDNTLLYFSITNESDNTLQTSVYFDIESDVLIGWQSPCLTIPAKSTKDFVYNLECDLITVKGRIKKCYEI